MKKSELKTIIREEINLLLNESMKYIVGDMVRDKQGKKWELLHKTNGVWALERIINKKFGESEHIYVDEDEIENYKVIKRRNY